METNNQSDFVYINTEAQSSVTIYQEMDRRDTESVASSGNLKEVAGCAKLERVKRARFNLFKDVSACRADNMEIHNSNPRKA